MDRTIDLDLAAGEALSKVARQDPAAVHVDALTWRDGDGGWPQRLRTDRSLVSNPDSMGIRVRRGSAEGSLVHFRGGWVDLIFFDSVNGIEVVDVVGHDEPLDLERFGLLVDRFLAMFQ